MSQERKIRFLESSLTQVILSLHLKIDPFGLITKPTSVQGTFCLLGYSHSPSLQRCLLTLGSPNPVVRLLNE